MEERIAVNITIINTSQFAYFKLFDKNDTYISQAMGNLVCFSFHSFQTLYVCNQNYNAIKSVMLILRKLSYIYILIR